MSETALVNSIIGVGTTFSGGQLAVSGLVRIDGDMIGGGITSRDRVIIGRSGRVDCTIYAATVVIGGIFQGTIHASQKVVALESAIIIGNIQSPKLIAESGVILDGAMHIGTDSSVPQEAPSEIQKMHKVNIRTQRKSWRRRAAPVQ